MEVNRTRELLQGYVAQTRTYTSSFNKTIFNKNKIEMDARKKERFCSNEKDSRTCRLTFLP